MILVHNGAPRFESPNRVGLYTWTNVHNYTAGSGLYEPNLLALRLYLSDVIHPDFASRSFGIGISKARQSCLGRERRAGRARVTQGTLMLISCM
eukprot:1984056-Pleurochrysis_carterae.AAC.4